MRCCITEMASLKHISSSPTACSNSSSAPEREVQWNEMSPSRRNYPIMQLASTCASLVSAEQFAKLREVFLRLYQFLNNVESLASGFAKINTTPNR
ncbi:hypothetical protein CEXT_424301 [Caerostris extrusa]|uniref:Uncharacterized protein n=1 Tax=Caerostris extrusa TaxID=172846 RepID=A0AAV4P8I4_CAEEX|nr:hypothetical protein CEXT_424301 [Caerostris extrusa]